MKKNKQKKIIFLIVLATIIFIPNIAQATQYTTKYVVCGADNNKFPYAIADIMSKLMLLIKIVVPILFVISGIISFFKVISSSSADEDMKKAQKKLINNVIAAVVIFLTLSIVNTVVKFVAGINNQVMPCINCFINPKDCTVVEETENLRPECIQNCESFTNPTTNTNQNTDTSQNNTNTNTNNSIVFSDGSIVYFNPVTATKCTEQEYNNNADKLGNSGCLKWYTFNYVAGDSTVNMILDHNTSETKWISADDYKNLSLSSELGVKYSVTKEEIENHDANYIDTKVGPLTLLKKIKEDTNNWSSKLLRTDKYKFQFMTGNYDWYEINYTGYKARLMSAEEAFKIVQPVNNGVYEQYEKSEFDWIFIEKEFWTPTVPQTSNNLPYYIRQGVAKQFIMPGPNPDVEIGLRPVITVSKTDIM